MKLGIILFTALSIILSSGSADPGFLHRLKQKAGYPVQKQPDVILEQKEVYIVDQNPCKGDRCEQNTCKGDRCEQNTCKGDRCEQNTCKSDNCQTCKNTCNGSDQCHNECVVVEKCRINCNGNDRCVNECGDNKEWNNYNNNDRCRGCGGCSGGHGRPQLTFCSNGKWLYYVQIPKTITISEFVSNPDLLRLYFESLSLDSDGISGRACLTDKTRLDLSKLKASLMPVAYTT